MRVTIDTKEVTVNELTVAQVRELINEGAAGGGETDVVNATLIDGVDFNQLLKMTDLTAIELDAMTPSQIQQVADAAREVNRHFFTLWGRIMAIASQTLSKPSTI
jgi:hypothetical protein